MLYTIPDYYKEFKCLADRCEDTCCAGWQIVIDKKSLSKYKKVTGNFKKTMYRNVNWLTGTFRQDKEKRCAFLNEQNLCNLYINQGANALCKTCRQYPRHTEEFEGVREISLSVSCPEVAGILMRRKEPVSFLTYEREGEEEFEDFDPFLFSILEDARIEMINILQNRELPISVRMVLVMGMAHDMQGRINRQEMFDCFSVMEKYCAKKAERFAEDYLKQKDEKNNRFFLAKEMYGKLYELELLREEWDNLLVESEVFLYRKGEENYKRNQATFSKWAKQHTDMDIQLEQLLVYFLFTYLPGAVYDGRIYSKVQMTAYCVWMIYELWMARWLKNEKTLQTDEIIEIVYRFSKEVEHSDENLEKVKKMMEKKWI